MHLFFQILSLLLSVFCMDDQEFMANQDCVLFYFHLCNYQNLSFIQCKTFNLLSFFLFVLIVTLFYHKKDKYFFHLLYLLILVMLGNLGPLLDLLCNLLYYELKGITSATKLIIACLVFHFHIL